MRHIPDVYYPMMGNPEILGPLRWQDDQSGVLPAAMLAFFEDGTTLEQLELVREYGEYYIHAPMWDWNPHLTEEGKAELARARRLIKTAHTRQDLMEWVDACLDMGIDPF